MKTTPHDGSHITIWPDRRAFRRQPPWRARVGVKIYKAWNIRTYWCPTICDTRTGHPLLALTVYNCRSIVEQDDGTLVLRGDPTRAA